MAGPRVTTPIPDRTTLAAFGVIVLFGGLNGLFVKLGDRELPPFWGATVRFFVSAAILFAVVGLRRIALPRGRALVGSILYGILNFAAFFGLLYWALVTAPAGLAMVILALAPLMTLLLAGAIGLERLRARAIVGSIIAAAGIGLVFVDRVGRALPLWSALAILAAAASIAGSTVVLKRFPPVHPVANNAVAMTVGTACLALLSILAGERWIAPSRPETVTALGYLVALGSVTMFVLYVFVIGRWTASATSYAVLLMPLVTVPVATITAGESLTPRFAIGAAVVLAGVYAGAVHTPALPSPARQAGKGPAHEAPALSAPGCP